MGWSAWQPNQGPGVAIFTVAPKRRTSRHHPQCVADEVTCPATVYGLGQVTVICSSAFTTRLHQFWYSLLMHICFFSSRNDPHFQVHLSVHGISVCTLKCREMHTQKDIGTTQIWVCMETDVCFPAKPENSVRMWREGIFI